MRTLVLLVAALSIQTQAFSQKSRPGSAGANRSRTSVNCDDATTLNLAAPHSEHINGYDFLNRACTPAQAIVIYGLAADHADKKLHIYIYDMDETILAKPNVAPYAPQVRVMGPLIKSIIATARHFDELAAQGNPQVLAAGHKRSTIIRVRGMQAAITIENDDPENTCGLYMMVNDRYAIEIRTDHYSTLGNDNRNAAKLLQPFAEATALETLIR